MSDPLREFRAQFVQRCAEALEILAGPTATGEVRRTIHHLSGSAGMFGFAEIGRLAAGLDNQAQEGESYDAADLAALVAELKAAVGAAKA